MPAIWATAASARARNAHDLADAVIDYADESGSLDEFMAAFLSLAKAEGAKARMFQSGLQQYTAQMSRYATVRRAAP